MQTIAVLLIIFLSVVYLAFVFMRSLRKHTKSHCSGCSKD